MPPLKEEDNQNISIDGVKGDVDAKNYNINHVDNIYIVNSEYIKTKDFEEDKDKSSWNKEELIVSLEDMQMIKDIIKKEEEIKETLPLLSELKLVFSLLPKTQKGLFITALQRVNREDKITKKITKEDGDRVEELDNETMELIIEEEQDEEYSKNFISDILDDYKKVYNIIRCGDIIRKIIPYIGKLNKSTSDKAELEERFEKYWYARLENHPYCIFINTFDKRWKYQILSKFDNREKEKVRVYARDSKRMVFALSICKEIAKERGLKINEKKYYIGMDEAIEIVFEI